MSEASQPSRRPRRGRNPRLRRGVGLVIINASGQVLAGLRSHTPSGGSAWQLPQGGIERNEKPIATVYRELEEETGLTEADVDLLHEMPRWTTYYLPKEWQSGKRFIGQTQRWFLLRYKHQGVPPISRALQKEFSALDWVDVSWLINHVIEFRKGVYRQVFHEMAPYLGTPQPSASKVAAAPPATDKDKA